MTKRTSSTDPHLRAVLDKQPATKGDLKEHEEHEELTMKKVWRARGVVWAALISLAVPCGAVLAGWSWAEDRLDKREAPLKAKDAAVEARVEAQEKATQEIKQELAAQREKLNALERGQWAVREDLRAIFPGRLAPLPPLPPPDGGAP